MIFAIVGFAKTATSMITYGNALKEPMKKEPKTTAHPDRGYLFDRIHFDRLEAELALQWEVYNKGNRPLSLIIGKEANTRDRCVAASVIQWMGTNCGFAFVCGCFNAVGLRVTGTEPRMEDPMLESMAVALAGVEARQATFDFAEPH